MPVLCLYQPGTNTLIWISSKSEVAIQLFRLILPRFVCGSYSKSAWPNCRIAGLIKNKIETWNVLPWSLIICITNWKKKSRILLWDLKLSMFFFLIIIRCNRHALEKNKLAYAAYVHYAAQFPLADGVTWHIGQPPT